MKTLFIAAVLSASAFAVAPAMAQTAAAAAAPADAKGAISVQTTPISDIVKNPTAKAALEKAMPGIEGYYAQIGNMTLAQLAPMSQGALTDVKLKEVQAEFDKIK